MPPKAKQAKATKGKSVYKLAEIDAEGLVFTDTFKRQWKIGKPIGSGGFGLIYSCSETSSTSSHDATYIMKIEPHENGPLFCELHYYQRVAKPDKIEQWKRERKLAHLGVPKFIASGSYEDARDKKYRFMVMERFGTDLQQLFEQNGRRFPLKTILLIGLQMLDVLEYIHENGYVHADIKASNILLADGQPNPRCVYLVDYGLASRYLIESAHMEYKEDPRKAHDGTLEFTSRDAHVGVRPSRRGDLEILGYCLLQWCAGSLPWDKLATAKDAERVRDKKVQYMNDIRSLLVDSKVNDQSGLFFDYFDYITKLDYKAAPDYKYVKDILRRGLPHSSDTTLVFSCKQPHANSTAPLAGQSARKRKSTAAASPASPAPSKRRRQPAASPAAPSRSATLEAAAAGSVSASDAGPALPKRLKSLSGPRGRPKAVAITPVPAEAANQHGGDIRHFTAVATSPAQTDGRAAGQSSSATSPRGRGSLLPSRSMPAADAGSPSAAMQPPAAVGTAVSNGQRRPAIRRPTSVSTASTQTSPSLKGLKGRRK